MMPSSVDAPRLLTAEDRCDSCGARAKVALESTESGLELFFCAHHAKKSRPAAEAAGFTVVALGDESD